MQRYGAAMPSDDFLSDFTQRLNIESAKMVKDNMREGENATGTQSSGKASGGTGKDKKGSKDDS